MTQTLFEHRTRAITFRTANENGWDVLSYTDFHHAFTKTRRRVDVWFTEDGELAQVSDRIVGVYVECDLDSALREELSR